MGLSVDTRLARVLQAGGIEAASCPGLVRAWRVAGEQAAAFSCCAAMVQDESWGLNVYGDDPWESEAYPRGYALEQGLQERDVTQATFEPFYARVLDGLQSDGVGPTQITDEDLLAQAHELGEKHASGAWDLVISSAVGFTFLGGLIREEGSILGGFTRYNGSAVYGARLVGIQEGWHGRLTQAGLT